MLLSASLAAILSPEYLRTIEMKNLVCEYSNSNIRKLGVSPILDWNEYG